MTFIRNEVKRTSIHHKNKLFVTNQDTNFWLIMVIVKVINGGIYHECRKKDICNPLTIVSYLLIKDPYKPTGDQPQAIESHKIGAILWCVGG